MTITDRIEQLLKSRGVQPRKVRSALAKTCGISHQAVSQWFTGETGNIKNENLTAIAAEYESTVDWLLTGKGEMHRSKAEKDSESNVIAANFSKARARPGEIDIPHYDVRAAMGTGQVLPSDYIETIRHVTISLDFMRSQGISCTQPDNLAMITGFGESMNKTFKSGDPLIIDQGIKTVTTDGVYLFSLSGALMVKRLQILPNGVRVLSDNEAYPPYEVTGKDLDNLIIHARVLLAWRSQRL
ncbi:XRE family transcriptional regulator [Pseudomonas sp. MYb185]|uniref:XRE family transcriptional regulator n=1 Tax=Pseudomonas sp. MYb185 TaxID=1848729 RepID=UPI000CFAE2A3|nr:S24 family peptidase [Pseudomonas sp. MYb185]PRB80512.1 phage repressor protein [Pseudomonas sp. MYb185]